MGRAARVCHDTRDREGAYLDTLAAAHAAAGQFADAVAAQNRASADPSYRRQYAVHARARLRLYKAGRAYVAPPEKR